ncbi:MAG: hypothetical protein VKK59_05780 [Vampirovibrionales bacterium]|nr:hypothetical protein [Vampirovibrionales bacterium]
MSYVSDFRNGMPLGIGAWPSPIAPSPHSSNAAPSPSEAWQASLAKAEKSIKHSAVSSVAPPFSLGEPPALDSKASKTSHLPLEKDNQQELPASTRTQSLPNMAIQHFIEDIQSVASKAGYVGVSQHDIERAYRRGESLLVDYSV